MPQELPELPDDVAGRDLRMISSVLLGTAVVAGLYVARDVFIPTTLAILLSFILAPLVSLLRRARIGRVPAVILAVGLALGMILAVGGLMSTQLSEVAHEAPRYIPAIKAKIGGLRSGFLWQFSGLTRAVSESVTPPNATGPEKAGPPPVADANPALADPFDEASLH